MPGRIQELLIQTKKFILKYTTVSGIDGFDGSRKEAPKAVVKAIDNIDMNPEDITLHIIDRNGREHTNEALQICL